MNTAILYKIQTIEKFIEDVRYGRKEAQNIHGYYTVFEE